MLLLPYCARFLRTAVVRNCSCNRKSQKYKLLFPTDVATIVPSPLMYRVCASFANASVDGGIRYRFDNVQHSESFN